jgi:hypothetical protein
LIKLFCRVEEGGFREVSRYGDDYTLHNMHLCLDKTVLQGGGGRVQGGEQVWR